MTTLPEPYGTCAKESDALPVSQCQADCKAQQVIQACQCRDIYMRVTDDSKFKPHGIMIPMNLTEINRNQN